MLKAAAIDKDWFHSKLDGHTKTVRGLARHLEIDASAVSRMLSGERRMKMEEAGDIATYLGVNIKEVLRHAGVALDLDGQPTRILLVATIDFNGQLLYLKSPRPLPQSVIDRAHAAIGNENGKVIAAQIRADKGPLAVLDDAVVLFKHTDTVDPAGIGTLCIGRNTDGQIGMGRVLKVRKTGEMVGLSFGGKTFEGDAVTLTRVLAILP